MTRRPHMIGLIAVVAFPAVAAEKKVVKLFDGKDLSQWTYHLDDPKAKMEDVWSVEGEILKCKGRPVGYLRTKADFENYKLTLDWRWPAGSKGGNSGVLLHTTTPNALGVWPKSLEAQLAAGNAGDIWVIGTTIKIDNPEGRIKDRRHLNLTDDSEKPIGEWNHYEIVCKGKDVTIKVNGDLVNHATDLSQWKGAICLQSEGAPIEFRNIVLESLE